MKIIKLLIILIGLFNISINTFAQNNLSGTVKNAQNQQAITNATIIISDVGISANTNSNGTYEIKDVPAGWHIVEIKNDGFKAQVENVFIKGNTTFNALLSSSSTELKEVVVTGLSTATEYKNNPTTIASFSQKNFQQNSYNNIIDAISNVPGVSQITEGPAISKPVIRGLGYNRVVVINDGIRQEGQQWGDEFGIEIDENTIDKAEILKGPASLSYGSDAIAGVINFLSPTVLPEGQVKGNVAANYGTNNGLIGGAINLGGNNKGFVWNVSYSNKEAHAYKNKYDGYVFNSGYGQTDFRIMMGLNKKWGYSHLIFDTYNLKLGIVEGARDSATGAFTKHVLSADGTEDSMAIAPSNEYTKYNYYPIIHQNITHYKAVWDNNLSINSKSSLLLRLGYQINKRQEANDITKGDIYNNYFYLQTFNYNAQYIVHTKQNTSFAVGIDGMAQASKDKGIVYLVPEYHSFDFGVFATLQKNINKKLTASGGVRFDNRTLQASDLWTDSVGIRTNNPTGSSVKRFEKYTSNFSGFSGSAGLTYQFTNSVYGKLNIAKGFRAPNIAESGSNGLHDGTPFYEIGDPNLKPESSLQVDATMGINNENITAEASLFRNQINNYIFAAKLASVFGGDSLRNDPTVDADGHPTFKYISGDAVLWGGEVVCNIHPSTVKWLRFENSISLLSATQLNQGDSTKYLPYTPPTKIQSALIVSFKNVHKNISNFYCKLGIERYAIQNKIYYKFGNETVTPGYTLINSAIGADLVIRNKKICTINICGNNLADIAYQSNMSRLKYADTNNVTGRVGVFNMGRNFSFKIIVPIDIKN